MGRMITGDVDGMIEYIHTIAGRDMAQNRLAFLLRLSVHVLLAMRDLDIPHNEQAANEIIREYVHALMEYHVVGSHTLELMAGRPYCSLRISLTTSTRN
jgi:hypothetical protein